VSEPCLNAKKVKTTTRTLFKCDPSCMICKGAGEIEDCPDCDGCGLRTGGVRCATCNCYGKVPLRKPAPQLVEQAAVNV
jgi:hypothetical protein